MDGPSELPMLKKRRRGKCDHFLFRKGLLRLGRYQAPPPKIGKSEAPKLQIHRGAVQYILCT